MTFSVDLNVPSNMDAEDVRSRLTDHARGLGVDVQGSSFHVAGIKGTLGTSGNGQFAIDRDGFALAHREAVLLQPHPARHIIGSAGIGDKIHMTSQLLAQALDRQTHLPCGLAKYIELKRLAHIRGAIKLDQHGRDRKLGRHCHTGDKHHQGKDQGAHIASRSL